MNGAFVLTMIATRGERSADSAIGDLALHPQDSVLVEFARTRQPLVGTAAIALESVGAVRMGDLGSTDPRAPGVGVYEQRAESGAPTVIVRLGSISNARGPQVFDAGHTTLYVRRIARDGFAGGWASSAGSVFPPQESRGYFCAMRTGA
jgi:hypothetical protein